MSYRVLGLLLVLAVASTGRAGAGERVVQLEEYGIMVNVMEEFDGVPTVTARCLIPLPQSVVWEVLSDYEGLADIIPAVSESRIVGEENGRLILRQRGRAGMWFVKKEFSVTFRVEEDPMSSIVFEAFEGDFETFRGVWRVKPARKGTLVRHEVQVVPKFWTPGWAMRRVAGDMMMDTLRGVVSKCFEAGRAAGDGRAAQ